MEKREADSVANTSYLKNKKEKYTDDKFALYLSDLNKTSFHGLFYRQKGITLISLVVTIIILLILAGVSIATLTGENSVINMAEEAKIQTEISEETESLELDIIKAMGKDKYGNITKVNLQSILNNAMGEGKVEVTELEDENVFLITIIESGRIYEVNEKGDIKYLGTETELVGRVDIVVNPENNTTPQLIQNVQLTVSTPLNVEDENITVLYSWNQNESEQPDSSKYVKATTDKKGRIRKSIINSSDTVAGNYYLWTKVTINEKETVKCFGPYAIKDHSTLATCTGEKNSTSGFLGNTNIARNLIQKVTIATSIEGHSVNDENCWDISQSKNGKYLAWYETNEAGYYEVTVAGNGGVVANSNSSYLFANIGYGIEDTVEINGLKNLDTGLVTNMNNMFLSCASSQIDVSNFNTSKVTNMAAMFAGCNNIKDLNLNNFKTGNVTSMQSMFNNCNNIVNLDLSSFETGNVTDMNYMFRNSPLLTNINLESFDTKNVTSMEYMFSKCESLTNLYLANFENNNLTSTFRMFNECKSLVNIDLSSFNTHKVTKMWQMFYNCESLTKLDLSNFNTSNVTDMGEMFAKCYKLTELNIKSFNTSNVTSMGGMFQECKSLTELDLSNFNTSNVKSMKMMFSSCSGLTELNIKSFTATNLTNTYRMFLSCKKLTEINFGPSFITNKVTDMERMFNSCESLTKLDLKNFATNELTRMEGIFGYCKKLNELDISGFYITDEINTGDMLLNVPIDCLIKINAETESWFTTNLPSYTNIEVVE